MKRVLSTVVSALVAIAFAGVVFAADATAPATGTEPQAGQAGTAAETAKPMKKAKKKKKKTRKHKKSKKAKKMNEMSEGRSPASNPEPPSEATTPK